MHFEFRSKQLQELYTSEKGAHKYAVGVVDAYFDVISSVHAAIDERDLLALRGLRYEKLKGKRAGECSLRLNDQWRLIVISTRNEEGPFLEILEIADYH